MRTFRIAAGTIVLTTIAVMPAMAQEPGRVGLLMTSDSNVGLRIEATERVAIRPEVGFIRTTSDSLGGERTTTSWSPGLSLLFELKSWDRTGLYLAPRWTYSRTTTGDSPNTGSAKAAGHAVSAMIGAQHNITDRFGVFGEVGVGRTSSKTESQFSTARAHYWSTRSAVGAILFF